MIIAILGEKLAGKDTVAEHLVLRHGAKQVKTSQILDELLVALNLPISRRNEIDAGRGMESVFGPEVIGKAVVDRVKNVKANIIVINGIRRPDQLDNAKNLGAKIIYVTAPVEVRHQRSLLRNRREDDGKQTLEEFKEQDKEWIEAGIPAFGKQADFKIENTSSLERLYGAVDEIMKNLKD